MPRNPTKHPVKKNQIIVLKEISDELKERTGQIYGTIYIRSTSIVFEIESLSTRERRRKSLLYDTAYPHQSAIFSMLCRRCPSTLAGRRIGARRPVGRDDARRLLRLPQREDQADEDGEKCTGTLHSMDVFSSINS